MTRRSLFLSTTSAALLCLTVPAARADQPTTAPVAARPGVQSSTKPEQIIVNGAPTNDQTNVVPHHPTSTTFGISLRAVDTPRTITTISSDQIKKYSVRSITDLTALVPGASTPSFYGIAGATDLRGTLADTYFHGFKRIENDGTFPTPLEAAASLDVLSGPPSPVFGAGKIGGLVNYTPKAYDALSMLGGDRPSGMFTAGFGSYNAFRQTLEAGAPFKLGSKSAAVDFFLENDNASDYYHGIRPRTKIAQGDFAIGLGDGWELNLGGQYYKVEGAYQNPGWNRVTQSLVDNGTYQAGTPIASYAQPGQRFASQSSLNANSPEQYVLPIYGVLPTPTAFSTLNPATLQTTTLSRRQVLVSGDDIGNSQTATGYLDLTKQLADSQKIMFQLFGDQANVNQYTGYGFAKEVRNWVAESRLSYLSTFHPARWLTFDNDIGASYRYYSSDEKYNFAAGNTSTDVRDISGPATPGSILNPIYQQPGTPWDQHFQSVSQDTGMFLNSNVSLFRRLHILAGARWDYYNVTSVNSGAVSFDVPLNTRYTAHQDQPSYTLSASFDLPYGIKPYITYAYEHSLETLQFGGIDPGNIRGNGYLSPSELVEAGIKGLSLDSQLYYAFDVYRQRRTQRDSFSGGVYGTIGQGMEAQIRYAVTKHFSLTATGNVQRTWVNGSTTLSPTPQELGFSGVSLYGSQIEAATSTIASVANGFVDHTIPNHVVSVFANYDVAEHWGTTGGMTYTSEVRGELPGAYHQGGYPLFRVSGYYQWRKVRFDLAADNLLDRRYVLPYQGVNTEDLVLPGMGRSLYGTISVKF